MDEWGSSLVYSIVRFLLNALRVSRAVTRLTVYRPHRVLIFSKSFKSFSIWLPCAAGIKVSFFESPSFGSSICSWLPRRESSHMAPTLGSQNTKIMKFLIFQPPDLLNHRSKSSERCANAQSQINNNLERWNSGSNIPAGSICQNLSGDPDREFGHIFPYWRNSVK